MRRWQYEELNNKCLRTVISLATFHNLMTGVDNQMLPALENGLCGIGCFSIRYARYSSYDSRIYTLATSSYLTSMIPINVKTNHWFGIWKIHRCSCSLPISNTVGCCNENNSKIVASVWLKRSASYCDKYVTLRTWSAEQFTPNPDKERFTIWIGIPGYL